MRHLLTLALFVGALFLYVLGAEKSSNLLMVLGACFEIASWKRMRSVKNRSL